MHVYNLTSKWPPGPIPNPFFFCDMIKGNELHVADIDFEL